MRRLLYSVVAALLMVSAYCVPAHAGPDTAKFVCITSVSLTDVDGPWYFNDPPAWVDKKWPPVYIHMETGEIDEIQLIIFGEHWLSEDFDKDGNRVITVHGK